MGKVPASGETVWYLKYICQHKSNRRDFQITNQSASVITVDAIMRVVLSKMARISHFIVLTIVYVIEQAVGIQEIVNHQRAPKTVTVLSCEMGVVPEGAGLGCTREIIRERMISNYGALIDECACFKESKKACGKFESISTNRRPSHWFRSGRSHANATILIVKRPCSLETLRSQLTIEVLLNIVLSLRLSMTLIKNRFP